MQQKSITFFHFFKENFTSVAILETKFYSGISGSILNSFVYTSEYYQNENFTIPDRDNTWKYIIHLLQIQTTGLCRNLDGENCYDDKVLKYTEHNKYT